MAIGAYNYETMLRAKPSIISWRGQFQNRLLNRFCSQHIPRPLRATPASRCLYSARGSGPRVYSQTSTANFETGSSNDAVVDRNGFHNHCTASVSLRTAWGYGLATVAESGTVLDTWYPEPKLGSLPTDTIVPTFFEEFLGKDPRRNVTVEFVTTEIDLDEPPASTPDAYLRLHVLSHLLVLPNTLNLDGMFSLLPNVVWTSAGPVHPDDFQTLRLKLQRAGIATYGMDKFPRLLDYVTPPRVRIADAARVRLGAHLAPGTTVMQTGFVNFNAGTLGSSMVEGRISQGVVIGKGSDLGSGASTMGTLSGGGSVRVTIGERSLLGANAGTGISLGDDCIVEAGLYLTRGTKVTIVDESDLPQVVKAIELSGVPGLLFRRHSVTGTVEVVARDPNKRFSLNAALHL